MIIFYKDFINYLKLLFICSHFTETEFQSCEINMERHRFGHCCWYYKMSSYFWNISLNCHLCYVTFSSYILVYKLVDIYIIRELCHPSLWSDERIVKTKCDIKVKLTTYLTSVRFVWRIRCVYHVVNCKYLVNLCKYLGIFVRVQIVTAFVWICMTWSVCK